MPTIITASELRSVLGVSSSLYSDAYLNQIIDTAETVILPMLVTFKAPIEKVFRIPSGTNLCHPNTKAISILKFFIVVKSKSVFM